MLRASTRNPTQPGTSRFAWNLTQPTRGRQADRRCLVLGMDFVSWGDEIPNMMGKS